MVACRLPGYSKSFKKRTPFGGPQSIHNNFCLSPAFNPPILLDQHPAKMPDRISSLVYLDAALPDPGQSLVDIIVSGGSDPMSFAGLEPAAPYVEKLQFDAQK